MGWDSFHHLWYILIHPLSNLCKTASLPNHSCTIISSQCFWWSSCPFQTVSTGDCNVMLFLIILVALLPSVPPYVHFDTIALQYLDLVAVLRYRPTALSETPQCYALYLSLHSVSVVVSFLRFWHLALVMTALKCFFTVITAFWEMEIEVIHILFLSPLQYLFYVVMEGN